MPFANDHLDAFMNASTPSNPIPWPAAVMSNGDDADHIDLQPVD